MWSEMYQCGYDNAAVCFAYIPDFKNDKEKKDFERGLKDGYAKVEQLKSGNINQQIKYAICKAKRHTFTGT